VRHNPNATTTDGVFKDCDKCGSRIALIKSVKGNWYAVEVLYDSSARVEVACRFSPHFKVCKGVRPA